MRRELRPSNTEPLLRLNLEEKRDAVLALIRAK
jgi:phosphomannomutase